VEFLVQDVDDLRKAADARHAALRTEIAQAEARSGERYRELAGRFEARERRAARVDARGIWVIGAGILLTGIPDELAAQPIVGGVVAAAAIGLTIWMGLAVRADFRQACDALPVPPRASRRPAARWTRDHACHPTSHLLVVLWVRLPAAGRAAPLPVGGVRQCTRHGSRTRCTAPRMRLVGAGDSHRQRHPAIAGPAPHASPGRHCQAEPHRGADRGVLQRGHGRGASPS
jgi:hypothetical protein